MSHLKTRSFILPGLGLLVLLGSLSPAFLQTPPPEVEGVYELRIAESQTVAVQLYFRDGRLRTLPDGDGDVTVWEAVEGRPLEFATESRRNGTF